MSKPGNKGNTNSNTGTPSKSIPSRPTRQPTNDSYGYIGHRIRNDTTVGSQQPYTPRVAPPDKGGKK